jgi:hypothetical protein
MFKFKLWCLEISRICIKSKNIKIIFLGPEMQPFLKLKKKKIKHFIKLFSLLAKFIGIYLFKQIRKVKTCLSFKSFVRSYLNFKHTTPIKKGGVFFWDDIQRFFATPHFFSGFDCVVGGLSFYFNTDKPCFLLMR